LYAPRHLAVGEEDHVLEHRRAVEEEDVGENRARHELDGDARLKLTLFGLVLTTADGTTRKGSPQILLPLDEGGRPFGGAYVIASGQIEQMNFAEFADKYPTPCAFFGGVLT
jgi:hypothetical protein